MIERQRESTIWRLVKECTWRFAEVLDPERYGTRKVHQEKGDGDRCRQLHHNSECSTGSE